MPGVRASCFLLLLCLPACGQSTTAPATDAASADAGGGVDLAVDQTAPTGGDAAVDSSGAASVDSGTDGVADCQSGAHVLFRYELMGATQDAALLARTFEGRLSGMVYQSTGEIPRYNFLLRAGNDCAVLELWTEGLPDSSGRYRASGAFSGGGSGCTFRWQTLEGSVTLKGLAGPTLEAELSLPFMPHSLGENSAGIQGQFTLKGSLSTACPVPTKSE